MEILIGNLISNALRYAPNNDEITILLTENKFRIENLSLNNKSLDAQKLFIRFQKQAFSNEKSIGIGLEICKKICLQNQWKIQYFYINNRHRFEVIF
jgi:K+-sensing histidine kinase KdpD